MSTTRSKGISDDKFGVWLRRESWLTLKLSALALIVGLAVSQALLALSPAIAAGWDRLNYQLSVVALDQHPVALIRTFGARLQESEYGWTLLDAAAPFNVTQARKKLRSDYPEVASVTNGLPQVPRAAKLRSANPAAYDARLAAYLVRYNRIEAGRFTSLYQRDDLFTPPNANVKLGILITKLFGLPDAFLFTLGAILSAGFASVLLFTIVLALSGRALWRSRRPARTPLKLIVWPALASTLVWGAIIFMAVAAALFGGFTPNTSALALGAALPCLYLLAQMPLQLGESLMLKTPVSVKWDGIERRKPRGPAPKPGETIPPMGGA
ncbi:MAG: hypothetical protein WCR49_05305 [Opitutae bacterium]